jgi:hypothetical protein
MAKFTTIPLQACESSRIAEHGYDQGTKTLALRFKSGVPAVYTYAPDGIRQQGNPDRQPGRGPGDEVPAERRRRHQHPHRHDGPLEGQGERRAEGATEWHRVTFFGRLAEVAAST